MVRMGYEGGGEEGRCAGEVIRRNGAKESSTLGRALCSYDRRDERKREGEGGN